MSRPDGTDTTPTQLTELEGLLVAFTASMFGEVGGASVDVVDRLCELGAPRWLLENIRRGAEWWTVSDDDRVAVIVRYAAKRGRAPENIVEQDVEQLRAVGLTDLDVVDLNNIVAYYS